MRRAWSYIAAPHPLYDRIQIAVVAFYVGVYAQAGELNIQHPVAFLAAIVLGVLLALTVLELIAWGLHRLHEVVIRRDEQS